MKKQKRSSQNGITLIALVITIIVLLILAGVAISAVVGENGIMNKATDAVVKTNKATALEEAQMVLVEWQTDNIVDKISYEGRTATTQSGASVICAGEKLIVVDPKNSQVYAANFPGYQDLSDEWKVVSPDSSDPAIQQIYKAMNPKIPANYEYVEGTWNTGFVISKKDGDSAGSQFVWVPVVSETSYARKSGSRNWSMSTSGANDCGKDVTQYILGDKLGLATILGTAITETERSGSTPANIPEAAVVNAAGGFYVSRYEMGIESTERGGSQDWSTGYTVSSKQGNEPARDISQEKSLQLANAFDKKDDVQSGLITGTEWDVMCNFIGWTIADGNCTSWGNYKNNVSKQYSSAILTGPSNGKWVNQEANFAKASGNVHVFPTGTFESSSNITTSQKNIYDIAGNVWEWTTEMPLGRSGYRVLRGGSAYYNGDDDLATYRNGYYASTFTDWDFGFRAVLYVK